jgi:protocatechuate 3,4-dioxygenase beta subunit
MTTLSAFGEFCRVTSRQTLGPYYPESDWNRDNDLTRRKPTDPEASGQVIQLSGIIRNKNCDPIENARVEIWQASPLGKYDHSQDLNPITKDPKFQYWGMNQTGKDGRYFFKTLIPGHYPLDPALVGRVPSGPGQFRPPHIHFKITHPSFRELVTQMYFDPRTYTDKNLAKIVDQLNRWENVPKDLVINFIPLGPKSSILVGEFILTLS